MNAPMPDGASMVLGVAKPRPKPSSGVETNGDAAAPSALLKVAAAPRLARAPRIDGSSELSSETEPKSYLPAPLLRSVQRGSSAIQLADCCFLTPTISVSNQLVIAGGGGNVVLDLCARGTTSAQSTLGPSSDSKQ